MTKSLEQQIRQVLGDLEPISQDMINGLTIRQVAGGAKVSFAIDVPFDDVSKYEPLRATAEKAIKQIKGVASVIVVLTAHRPAKHESHTHEVREQSEKLLTDVKHIIAVASGKGGVGKSTTAVNMAVALSKIGLKTGLLDADIFGPSIPRMMGLNEKPQLNDDDKLVPFERYGVKVMSIGNLIPEGTPVIWRGPMVHGALRQLLADVAWGELDILLIDMPPGTGDAPLSLAHMLDLCGAIIVCTPQDIALIDARKAIGMFQKMNVPVLGIIENMSQFVCPHCGNVSAIFGHGGAQTEATQLGLPFLGELPLDMTVRTTSDEGSPIAMQEKKNPVVQTYFTMVEKVLEQIQRNAPTAPDALS